jgi:glycerol-3-phosphate acyltransferase PlsY
VLARIDAIGIGHNRILSVLPARRIGARLGLALAFGVLLPAANTVPVYLTQMLIAIAFVAYLIGSISFAVLVSRVMGLPDPRAYGSGNPGATNVLRSGRKWAAALTLIGDTVKGWLPVWVLGVFASPPTAVAVAAVAVVLGHVFSIFLAFRGGKGVATALGAVAGLSPLLALSLIAVWLLVALLTRYSSLAAICATLTAGAGVWLLSLPIVEQAAVSIIALLVLTRHRQNIAKLYRGEEGKIGATARTAGPV